MVEVRPNARHRNTAGIVAALAVTLAPATAAAQRAEGSFQRTVTVAGAPRVDVSTGSGRIEVRTGPAGRVDVTATIRANDGWGWKRSGLTARERVRRIEANPPVAQSGGNVRIGHIEEDDLRRGVSISYTVTVPSDSSLISRTGSGSQQIDGVAGEIDASSGSGSLVFRNAGGPVRASAGSGGITADTVGGSFRATTGSGSIRADAVRGAIVAKTGSGSIDIGQVSDGEVEARSGSGSIHLRGIRGGVGASTASGGLTIQGELAGDWRLSSSSGTIRVSLPSTQGFELDAHSSSGNIETEFPVAVTGTSRRTLRGAAQGGGPLLHLRTSSGGISVKRGANSARKIPAP